MQVFYLYVHIYILFVIYIFFCFTWYIVNQSNLLGFTEYVLTFYNRKQSKFSYSSTKLVLVMYLIRQIHNTFLG